MCRTVLLKANVAMLEAPCFCFLSIIPNPNPASRKFTILQPVSAYSDCVLTACHALFVQKAHLALQCEKALWAMLFVKSAAMSLLAQSFFRDILIGCMSLHDPVVCFSSSAR